MAASIRTAALIALTCATLLLYAVGCGDRDEPGTGDDPGAAPITLETSGGFAPIERTVTIGADGSARVVEESFDGKRTDRHFTPEADELRTIRAHLDDLDLGSLDLPPSPDCCDLVYFELTYDGTTIKTDVSTAPEELADVIDDINGLAPPHGDG